MEMMKGCVVVVPNKMNCSNSDVFATESVEKEAIDNKQGRNGQVETDLNNSVNMDLFPWMAEFQAMYNSSLARHDSTSLTKLMTFFYRNVSSNVNDCYKKSSRAAELKELIKEALLLFMYFRRVQQPQTSVQNDKVYLEQMSDLLALYIDLELVVSREDVKPQPDKISARLVSYLYVYLENSTEHLLDTLIKVQLVNNTFSHILDSVFLKVSKIIPPHPDSEVMYVRYLLAYRLWKTVHSDSTVTQQITENAISSLGSVPMDLPKVLIEQVLPTLTPTKATSTESLSTKFYLCQPFDLRKACSQFVQFYRTSKDDEKEVSPNGDIVERDQRLKSTITSETNKLNSINIEFSKSSNSLYNCNSIQNINNISLSKLEINCTKESGSSLLNNSTNLNNKTIVKPNIFKKKKSKKSDEIILIDLTDEDVTKIVKTQKRQKIAWLEALKRNIHAKVKEVALQRKKQAVDASLKITTQQLEDTAGRHDKSPSVESVEQSQVAPNSTQQIEHSVEDMKEETSSSSQSTSEKSKIVCCDIDSITEATNSITVDKRAKSKTSSNTLRLEEVKEKVSALRNTDVLSEDKQPTDSIVSSAKVLEENSLSTEMEVATVAISSQSVICGPTTTITTASPKVVEKAEPLRIVTNIPVNSTSSKTDYYPQEQKVQQVLIAEKSDISSIDDFYNIQESDIDGLTLLASVSAQQQVSTNHQAEVKIKPYSSLQEKPKDEGNQLVVDHFSGMYPGDTLDKVALQVEVSSADVVSNSVKQDTSLPELSSYMLDDAIQNNLETNDNTNVILNGETVVLMQKSPYSNLYIINKAAVDNLNNGKVNYNSDEEDANRLVEPEETKYCQQAMMIKCESDEGALRGRSIKPDPDYVDVKSNVLVHEEPKHQTQSQGYELQYATYPVPAPGTYCTYPNMHHPSAGCACVNRAYGRQMPYYIPTTHTAQVQSNPAVQEKRSSKMTETDMLDRLYDQFAQENRMRHVGSNLPLKKRLKAQRMMSMDLSNPTPESPLKTEVQNTYPGTLMMSIADVQAGCANPPHDLGAIVEVTSAAAKVTKRSRKEKPSQNGSFIKKGSGKKKLAVEEVENSASPPKKAKKTNTAGKQTRSSRRIVPTVNYVDPDIDPEWNPSGKRKRKRNTR